MGEIKTNILSFDFQKTKNDLPETLFEIPKDSITDLKKENRDIFRFEEPHPYKFEEPQPYKNYIDEIFKTRKFLSSESWNTTETIQAKVLNVLKDSIVCECLIDKENQIFENRSFPKYLFEHLSKVDNKSYIFITIKSKSGSSRIDILDGSKLVDKQIFELKKEWDNIEDSNFSSRLDGTIEL